MPNKSRSTAACVDLLALRGEITELIVRNAVSMVQHAIDSVHENGQHQAMKYLFEMIGLYPALGNDGEEQESSLAAVLLSRLGIEDVVSTDPKAQS